MSRTIFLLASAIGMVSSAVAFADDLTFTYANNSNYDVTALHLGAASQQGWGADILGGSPIPAGTSRTLTINDGLADCYYDIYANNADGFGAIQEGIEMCAGGTVVDTALDMSPDFASSSRGDP